MSIISELSKTKNHLRNARKAILGRGGEISFTAGLKDLPQVIYNIPADASLAYQSDTSVAYQKIVPVGSQEFAQVAKIGGMTYKAAHGNNYMTDLYVHSGDETLVTINADGSITVTNPDGEYHYFEIGFNSSAFGGKYFTATGDVSGFSMLSIATEYFNEEEGYWEDSHVELDRDIPEGEDSRGYFEIYPKYEVGSWTFKPLIVDSPEDAKPRLIDTKVTELVSEGAQLIPFPYRKAVGVPTTQSGVTFTVLEDGGISVVGIPTADTTYVLGDYNDGWQNILKIGETYTVSGGKDKVIVNVRTCPIGNPSSSSSYIESANSNSQSKVFPEGREVRVVGLYISPTCVGQEINTVIYPMLNRGSTAAPYKPYRADAVDTLAIAEKIQAIDGYGRGVNAEYHNYIDGERKVFVQNTYRKVFDGTETFYTLGEVADGTYRIAYALPKTAQSSTGASISPILASSYDTVTGGGGIWYSKNGIALNEAGTHIFIYDKNFNDGNEDTWKVHLAQLYASGNPLVIEYALATPIETDISSYLPSNFISVEGGGAITFVNEFEQKAPSTINYIFETEGE